jgi:chloramphenicol-sensitive protein RarD
VLDGRRIFGLVTSGALIACNWGIFIWALKSERLVEASLGYFINPLVSVLLGVLVLREKLTRPQMLALTLAAAGVLNQVVSLGVVPWMGLALALTFGCYGLVRKQIGVDSVVGLSVETLLVLPLALAWIAFEAAAGQGALVRGRPFELGLLAASGFVTVVPLICFAAAALRLPLITLGFVQYLSPCITLFLAVFLYHEPFGGPQYITFAGIWAGLVIFSLEALYHQSGFRSRRGGEEAA